MAKPSEPAQARGERMTVRDLDPEELTGPLLRAARALTGHRADVVASATLVSASTIKRAEASASTTTLTRANQIRLIAGYADFGVAFFSDDRGSVGVKLSSGARADTSVVTDVASDAQISTAPHTQGNTRRKKTELPKFLIRSKLP